MTPENQTKIIYENINDVIPQIRLIQKWSVKKARYYDFIEISFDGQDYKKLIIIQDIEKMLIDTLKKQTKTELKSSMVDEERSFLKEEL